MPDLRVPMDVAPCLDGERDNLGHDGLEMLRGAVHVGSDAIGSNPGRNRTRPSSLRVVSNVGSPRGVKIGEFRHIRASGQGGYLVWLLSEAHRRTCPTGGTDGCG